MQQAHTRVWAKSPSRHDVGRTEGSLLHLTKVVFDVLVQDDSTKRPVREILRRQRLGWVKDVDRVLLRHLRADDLTVDVPRGRIARLDVLKQGAGHVVWVGAGALAGLGRGQVLVALVRLDVELDIIETSVLQVIMK